ncbi:Reverse transcriptase (RNA-dependent DNA polymerase) [Fragilaria crotonensis]|nr:Reverse transcriptase (RNA-dependent DNA polymerase) [Fragilaria crotonensis]
MPGYIERALLRFQHIAGRSPEHSPHPWQRPNYGAKTQFATLPDATPTLDAADKTRILEVLGTLLFYARAIDSTMLTAIGELATEQSQATTTTMEKLSQLLNYCAAHPDATVRFTASDMILAVESDASYLSVVKGRSRAAGYFFLTNKLSSPNAQYRPNGAVHVLCHIMREVLSSAAEAELGALFHNGEACPLRIALEMGHPQSATPMATDNNTASGIATDTVKQKRSKAIDMRFYWIRDRVRQGQFKIYWSKGTTNRADYFSKHHPASHHQAIRSTYLYSPTNPTRNYFECLADTAPAMSTTVHSAKSLTFSCAVPGEGVLFSPENPECHCDVTNDITAPHCQGHPICSS